MNRIHQLNKKVEQQSIVIEDSSGDDEDIQIVDYGRYSSSIASLSRASSINSIRSSLEPQKCDESSIKSSQPQDLYKQQQSHIQYRCRYKSEQQAMRNRQPACQLNERTVIFKNKPSEVIVLESPNQDQIPPQGQAILKKRRVREHSVSSTRSSQSSISQQSNSQQREKGLSQILPLTEILKQITVRVNKSKDQDLLKEDVSPDKPKAYEYTYLTHELNGRETADAIVIRAKMGKNILLFGNRKQQLEEAAQLSRVSQESCISETQSIILDVDDEDSLMEIDSIPLDCQSTQDEQTTHKKKKKEPKPVQFSPVKKNQGFNQRYYTINRAIRCKNCNQGGHFQNQCPEPLHEFQTKCIYCRQEGHLDLNCDFYKESCLTCGELGHRRNKCKARRDQLYSIEFYDHEDFNQNFKCVTCQKLGHHQCKNIQEDPLRLPIDIIVCQALEVHREYADSLRHQRAKAYLPFQIKDHNVDIFKAFNIDQSLYDQDAIMAGEKLGVPEDHFVFTIYCPSCGQQNHTYETCDFWKSQRRRDDDDYYYSGTSQAPVLSYSGPTENRKLKRQRRFEQSDNVERMIEQKKDLIMSKVEGRSQLLNTASNIAQIPVAPSQPIDIIQTSLSTLEKQLQPQLMNQKQIRTETEQERQQMSQLWSGPSQKPPQVEMSLKNRMALNYWKK